MAFQPIVNTRSGEVFAQEALARGLNGEGAGEVFRHVNDDNRYRFDQACRVKAIELAAQLQVGCSLSINSERRRTRPGSGSRRDGRL